MVLPYKLRFRIPNLLVKCLSLQAYLVTIPTSSSGVIILLSYTFCYNFALLYFLQQFCLPIFHATIFFPILFTTIVQVQYQHRMFVFFYEQDLTLSSNLKFDFIHQTGVTWGSLGPLQLYQSQETISGGFNLIFVHILCNYSIY